MAFTRQQAYQTLAALNPAPVFLQSYEVKRLPENLDIHFGPPEEFFLAADTQDPYTRGRLVPLLDDSNFGLVTFYDPADGSLVQMDVEEPGRVRERFANWQQYLADLMIVIGESGVEDERFRRIAGLVQFGHVDELFAFFDRVAALPHDDYHAARRQFVSGIGGHP
ncbi:MAG TPA: hypothetical protein VGF55_17210 [Gemmataceae bacterium]|jgi:hypothetical protein